MSRPCRGVVKTLAHPATEISLLPGRRRNVGATCYRASAPVGALSKRRHNMLPSFRPCRGVTETLPQTATELSPLPGCCRDVSASCYRAFAPAGASSNRRRILLPSFCPCRGVAETLPQPATELAPQPGRRRNGDTTRYRTCAPDGALLNRWRNLLPSFCPCRGVVETLRSVRLINKRQPES